MHFCTRMHAGSLRSSSGRTARGRGFIDLIKVQHHISRDLAKNAAIIKTQCCRFFQMSHSFLVALASDPSYRPDRQVPRVYALRQRQFHLCDLTCQHLNRLLSLQHLTLLIFRRYLHLVHAGEYFHGCLLAGSRLRISLIHL